jgi:hypothetical protein
MPAIPNSENNFILGLSDFWTKIFQEAPALAVMYDGMQLQVGQTYLDLLSDVLSISLQDVPLFSKRYYQYVPIREDQVRFVEGASRSDNRFVFTAPLQFTQLGSLMNRVVFPTVILEEKLDYDLNNGVVSFKKNLFDVDGEGGAVFGVPQRTVQVQFPYDFFDVTVPDWKAKGVLPGDIFRIQFVRGVTVEVPIALVRDRLVLADDPEELAVDLRSNPYSIDVLRVPFDTVKQGVEIPNVPSLYQRVANIGGVFHDTYRYVQGSTTVDFTATDGSGHSLYLNKYLYINDPVYDENNGVFRIRGIVDAQTIDVDRPAPFYNPAAVAWVSGTAYAKRAVVASGSNVYYALEAHTAGASFAADLATGKWALYLLDLVVLDYHFPTLNPPGIPVSHLLHNFLVDGSVTILARRLLDRRVGDVVYPAQGGVVEGIDYVIDLETGAIFHLSAWDSTASILANYEWRLPIFHRDVPAPTPWEPGRFYYKHQTIVAPDGTYWFAVEEGLSSALFVHDLSRWRPWMNPIGVNPVYPSRELAFWAPDVMLDEQRLYENFGYLLAGSKTDSSESYRSFLLGVMQLFVLGPAVQRLESALNVMGGLPVVRDDGEVFQTYDNGVIASGTDGQLTDGQLLRDGAFTTDGHFVTADGNFFPSDLLATVTISRAADTRNDGTYVVQTVNGPGDVYLTPAPLTAEVDTGFIWRFTHVAITKQFTAVSYSFDADDVGGYIVIESADNAGNIGTFKILAVVNSHTVLLDAPEGFLDEAGLSWKLTHRNTQIVTTDKRSYEYPFLTPMRRDLSLATSAGNLTFKSFEPLTNAFQVLDYLVDPTWFHNLTIPAELLQLAGEEGGRRRVSTALIPHVVNALDGANSGDPGLVAGADDEGRPPPPRKTAMTWTKAAPFNVVYLDEPIGVGADVGQYLTIGNQRPALWQPDTVYAIDDEVYYNGFEYWCTTAHTSTTAFDPFKWDNTLRQFAQGSYKILAVSADGLRLTLDRFPPPGTGPVPPATPIRTPRRNIDLPPFLHRRTVGFVVMDRFLKYHSFRVRINTRSDLNATLVAQLSTLIQQTKPSHTFVFVDPATLFEEVVSAADPMALNIGILLAEGLPGVINDIVSGTVLHSGDAYSYLSGTAAGVLAGGAQTITITPVIPGWAVGPTRTFFVFARFTAGHNTDGSRIAREGVDYAVNYSTGQVSIVNGQVADGYSISWVAVLLRNVASPSQANGENAIVAGGADPTIVRPAGMDPATTAGLIERPIKITVT